MALSIWFQCEYKSLNSEEWKIDILDSEATHATPVQFNVTNPNIQFQYKGLKERFDPVMSSECNFTALVQESNATYLENFISEMSAGVEGRFYCKVYKKISGTYSFWWGGVMIPDIGNIEDIYYPYNLEISFTDGLGTLKEIDFWNNGVLYSGFESIFDILLKLLAKTDNILWSAGNSYIKTCIHYYDANHYFYANVDPLIYSRVDHSSFHLFENDMNNPMKCYDVLVQLLNTFDARIFLINGMWHIFQSNEMINTTQITRRYTYGSTTPNYLTGENFRVSTGINNLTGGSFSFLPPFRKVSKKYKYKGTSQGTNLLPVQSDYSTAVALLQGISGGNDETLFFDGIINQTIILDDPFSWNTSFYIKYRLDLILTFGDNSKNYLYNGVNGMGDTTWSTHSNNYYVVWIMVTPTHAAVMHKPSPVDFYTPEIPANCTGTFQFQELGFYGPDHLTEITVGITNSFTCDQFSLDQLLANSVPTEGEIIFFSMNNNDKTTKEYEFKDALLGDGPNPYSLGRIQTYNGVAWVNSTLWRIKNDIVENKIHQLVVNEAIGGQQVPCKQYSGDIVALTYDVSKTLSMYGAIYYALTVTYNTANDTWSGTWFEINLTASTPQMGMTLEEGIEDEEAEWYSQAWTSSEVTPDSDTIIKPFQAKPSGFIRIDVEQVMMQMSNILQLSKATNTDTLYETDDVITSLSVDSFSATLATGTIIQLIDPVTFDFVELTVDANLSGSLNSITVVSYTFTRDFRIGSYLIVKRTL